MAKRKPAVFSATKAVKANARERVGQPKPSRVLPDKPRQAARRNINRGLTKSFVEKNEREEAQEWPKQWDSAEFS